MSDPPSSTPSHAVPSREDLSADEYGEHHHGATDKQYIIIALILAVDHRRRGDAHLPRRRARSSCPRC